MLTEKTPRVGALSASEAACVVDSLGQGVLMVAPDDRVVYANRAATELLRWPLEELTGQPLAAIIPELPNDRAQRAGPLVVPARRRDGSEVPVELVLTTGAQGEGITVLVAFLRTGADRQTPILASLLPALAEATTVEDATAGILRALGEELAWDVTALWLRDRERGSLHCAGMWHSADVGAGAFEAASFGRTYGSGVGLPGRVLETGQAAWINDVALDSNFPRAPTAAAAGLRAAFAFPVTSDSKVLGVMEFLTRQVREPDAALLRTLTVVGEELGRFLEQRMREQERVTVLANEQAALARADTLARTLQASLLPPVLPQVPGLDLAARYRAAGEGVEVGGDFYDVFQSGRGRWGLVIGDVCGKGAEAARLTALARYTVRAAAMESRNASGVLSVLNEALLQQAASDGDPDDVRFVSVLYGLIRRMGDRTLLSLSCGGHLFPFVVRAAGAVERAGCPGMLLGLFSGMAFREVELELVRGDAVVLFTDGVTEGRNRHAELGEGGLQALLERLSGASAGAIADEIEAAAVAHGAGSDDMAVLVARVTR